MNTVRLPVDSRNRISLTKLFSKLKVRSLIAYWRNDKIILEPMVEIPASEAWLFENEPALKKVKRGLSQKGTTKRGSFSKYIKD